MPTRGGNSLVRLTRSDRGVDIIISHHLVAPSNARVIDELPTSSNILSARVEEFKDQDG